MFVRYISHEIRTPLNIVLIGLNFLFKETAAAEMNSSARRRFQRTLGEVKESCDIAVNILNDLLTLDKLESDTLKLEMQELKSFSFLKETIRPFRVQVGIQTAHQY